MNYFSWQTSKIICQSLTFTDSGNLPLWLRVITHRQVPRTHILLFEVTNEVFAHQVLVVTISLLWQGDVLLIAYVASALLKDLSQWIRHFTVSVVCLKHVLDAPWLHALTFKQLLHILACLCIRVVRKILIKFIVFAYWNPELRNLCRRFRNF